MGFRCRPDTPRRISFFNLFITPCRAQTKTVRKFREEAEIICPCGGSGSGQPPETTGRPLANRSLNNEYNPLS